MIRIRLLEHAAIVLHGLHLATLKTAYKSEVNTETYVKQGDQSQADRLVEK